MRAVIVLGLSAFLISLFSLFQISFTSYFSQDDFYHLRTIMDKNMIDIPSFFIKKLEGQTFYRPISRETYNLIMYKAFGLNPVPFHLVNVFLILVNLRLIYLLVKKVTNNSRTAYLTVLIYTLSSVHNIELYYLASVQNLLMTTLTLLVVILYLRFLKEKNLNDYLAAILLFLSALLCHESALIIPGVIFLMTFLKNNLIKNKMVFFLPFVILALIFILSITGKANLPDQSVYQPVFEIKWVLNTLGWYILWSFGLPEMLVDFVKSKFIIKDEFFVWYGYYTRIVFPLVFLSIFILLGIIWSRKKKIFSKDLLIFLLSFLFSLTPFLFFPQHKFVYYLSLPIVWFSGVYGIIFESVLGKGKYKAIAVCLILSISIISYQTSQINSKTHWAAKRAKSAESIIKDLKRNFPYVAKGTSFYLTDDPDYPNIAKEWGSSSKQAFYILSGSDAFQLLYKDSSIKVYFESLREPPEDSNSNLISLVAKFPY